MTVTVVLTRFVAVAVKVEVGARKHEQALLILESKAIPEPQEDVNATLPVVAARLSSPPESLET